MNCAGLPSVQKQLGFSTRRKFVEVVTAITVGAGMTPNAMAFGQGALHHPGLEASRFGRFPHGGLRDRHGGDLGAYEGEGYRGHYGILSRWGMGLGLGVFGYDDRYCSPSYHTCDVYGR